MFYQSHSNILIKHRQPVIFEPDDIGKSYIETDSKKIILTKNILLIKNPQFCSDLAEILAILPTHELIILTKFDGDWTKIVDFLLVVYFWASIIFFNQSLLTLGGCKPWSSKYWTIDQWQILDYWAKKDLFSKNAKKHSLLFSHQFCSDIILHVLKLYISSLFS